MICIHSHLTVLNNQHDTFMYRHPLILYSSLLVGAALISCSATSGSSDLECHWMYFLIRCTGPVSLYVSCVIYSILWWIGLNVSYYNGGIPLYSCSRKTVMFLR